ncbi:MAG: adenylate/guanylate cyclase domain-containing protein [Chloroflexi bacterium]|nr:adenylate/guanylate cyclase domain-containing protein [Chloroflexota bacterium]
MPERSTRPDVAVAHQCLICGTWLSGPVAVLFRVFGVGRSPRNANLCTRCNTHVEEGRVVELTVLFADLASFTELTHAIGPERVHAVVDSYLAMATAAVVQHDGFIDKYIGDAVMAFFNVPIRRADHGARAVAAGSDILDGIAPLARRFALDLQARVGVAIGWAHVGRLGSADRRDYTAIGSVVNLAARLEALAEPGEMVADRAAFRDVAADYPAASGEWIVPKGFPEPVEIFRLHPGGGSAVPVPATTPPTGDTQRGARVSVGGHRTSPLYAGAALFFAVLGAPCAAALALGPLAVWVGLGAMFGMSSTIWLFDAAPIRIPLLATATLGALATLLAGWYSRAVRLRRRALDAVPAYTPQERRRAAAAIGASALTIVMVLGEVISHAALGHAWP